jgi:Domain of unknown function (DUF4136)
MHLTHRLLRAGLAAVAAAALMACATGPEIQQDLSPVAEFGRYKTFGYFSPLATDRAGYESVLTSRLKDVTRRIMESKGYAYSEANPDLQLNFFANVQERQEIRSYPYGGGYYGYRRGWYGGFGISGVESYSYQEGTLAIDLVEVRRKLLVWQASATGVVSEEARRNPAGAIEAVVPQMMSTLPPAGGR